MAYQYLQTAEATLTAIKQRLTDLTQPFDGAHFAAAFVEEKGVRLVTANVVFRDQRTAPRPSHKYKEVQLVEEWVSGQWDAHRKLATIFEGKGEIGGIQVADSFAQTNIEHQTGAGPEGWPMWKYNTRVHQTPGWTQLQIEQGPVVTYDLEPYLSISQAVSDYVERTTRWDWGSGVFDLHSVVTFVPDMRAKFLTAEWSPGSLRLAVEARIPVSDLQVQLVHVRSEKRAQVVNLENTVTEISVPDDAQELYLFLVHSSGETIQQLRLSALYDTFGITRSTASLVSRIESDLAAGEAETVEYKPFMSPNDEKESEFVDCVIAFANTGGGAVYVGINEKRGTPQGRSEVVKRFKKELQSNDVDQCLEAQRIRLRNLISNNIKPIPPFDLTLETYLGEPIVMALIHKSDKGLCSTHDNKIYVRKGSTNRMPSSEELSDLLAPRNNGLFPLGLR